MQSAKYQLATGQFPTISLKWPIKISAWCIHFVHMANQIQRELEEWPTISNFLFRNLMLVMEGIIATHIRLS